jgi:hypothetical protein
MAEAMHKQSMHCQSGMIILHRRNKHAYTSIIVEIDLDLRTC